MWSPVFSPSALRAAPVVPRKPLPNRPELEIWSLGQQAPDLHLFLARLLPSIGNPHHVPVPAPLVRVELRNWAGVTDEEPLPARRWPGAVPLPHLAPPLPKATTASSRQPPVRLAHSPAWPAGHAHIHVFSLAAENIQLDHEDPHACWRGRPPRQQTSPSTGAMRIPARTTALVWV